MPSALTGILRSSVVPVVFRFLALVSHAAAINVELISIIPYNISVGAALSRTGTALELSAEDVQRQYDPRDINLTITYLYDAQDKECWDADAHAATLLADYYNTVALNRCVAVMAATTYKVPCGPEYTVESVPLLPRVACGGLSVAPFLAKEWNVLLFTNSLVSNTVFNPRDAQTSVDMAGSYLSVARAIFDLVGHFQFRRVTVLLDTSVVSEVYRYMADAMLALVHSSSAYSRFENSVSQMTFDSNSTFSMVQTLSSANQAGRVLLALGPTLSLVKLLRAGRASGAVTASQHVFVNVQPTQQPVNGPATDFDDPGKEDVDIFRHILYLTTYAPPGDQATKLNARLSDRQQATYRTTLDDHMQPLDQFYIREAYNSVQLFARLVNESRLLDAGNDKSQRGLCAGTRLKPLLNNRTLLLPTGRIHFTAEGSRQVGLILYFFNSSLQKMQIAAEYDVMTNSYIWKTSVVMNISRTVTGSSISVSTMLPLLIIVFLFLPLSMYKRIRAEFFPEPWWMLEKGKLECKRQYTVLVPVESPGRPQTTETPSSARNANYFVRTTVQEVVHGLPVLTPLAV